MYTKWGERKYSDFANFKSSSIKDIWNNEEYISSRSEFADKSEITKARINDNLLKLEQELSEETVKNIKNQVQLDIQEAVDFAESSEFPKESELLENVYG